MGRPLLLDLYCGAGGAARGYELAGFELHGIDNRPQPAYPYPFTQTDALEISELLDELQPAAIHASPPCQAYSVLRRANPGASYPDLISPTRELLQASGVPWVIENVPGAPLKEPITLCGSMFGLGAGPRQLRRHRLFETSFFLLQPQCQHQGEAIGVYGGGTTGRYTFNNGGKKDYYNRRGGYQGTAQEKAEAMQINWMNRTQINQAIPPAYCRFIGEQLLAILQPQISKVK